MVPMAALALESSANVGLEGCSYTQNANQSRFGQIVCKLGEHTHS